MPAPNLGPGYLQLAASRQGKIPAGQEERWPLPLTTGAPRKAMLGEGGARRRSAIEGKDQCMLRAREESPDARKLLVWLVVGLLVSLRTFPWERAA